ncbi:LacI family DNA-binding transcriptional regulator [Arenibacter sp. ARW7G5Y1]|uniref:LacI family DNA-binding transcriptional regulator n=1 Tax=Arenibacter sp. ARW7G5Y1 TaxID=2135619 RepID=UPI000D763279|nr:LacI family DNA-binding transcriptional regulator [Arenibacter sp. ARW7G5Y1]PXX29050.1 LacI family transcriptional regulator [Arenibacter sp. ARW7G5Y1]
MKKKRYSIKDIAQELKVSRTTISFILNGKAKEKRISEALTKRVLEYVEKVGYQPHSIARSLRTGKSRVLVVMVEDIYSKLARIIEDVAYKKGYRVLFCSNDNDDKKSRALLKLFRDRQVDGYIIVPSPGVEKEIRAMDQEGVPVVLFDRYFPALKVSAVLAANKQATYAATKHLITNGFTKIIFLTIDSLQTQMMARKKGYCLALEEHGLEPIIVEIPTNVKNSLAQKDILMQLMKKTNDFDAMFFGTNYLAVSALELMKEEFPSYLNSKGFFTFDDSILFKLFSPSISAISQPLKKFGELLMEMIVDKIESPQVDDETDFKIHTLDCDIEYRESSMPLKDRSGI